MDDAHPIEWGTVFDAVAQRYAARRPTYPQALFDALAAYSGLHSGSRVLEIAPGTGQTTVAMAWRGWTVTAVELGPAMAALARRALAGTDAEVVVSAVEDWPLPREPFDAVVCATAWHWVDPAVRLVEAAEALRPGGTLGIVRTHHVVGGSQDFFERAQECYLRHDPDVTEPHVLPTQESLPVQVDELEDSHLVADVQQHLFAFEVAYDGRASPSFCARTRASPRWALPTASCCWRAWAPWSTTPAAGSSSGTASSWTWPGVADRSLSEGWWPGPPPPQQCTPGRGP